ncbi:MAG: hypothetical protein NZ853_02395 [Leptospiraceae bacterium]|nr:hypothetical protein [Leptospiraceae bacterium]MDW7975029.1 hypothetical protein [Leptospiraceae bacterium]
MKINFKQKSNLFFLFVFLFSFGFYFYLSSHWNFSLSLLFSLLPSTIIMLLVWVFIHSPLEKIENFLQQRFLLKFFVLVLLILLLSLLPFFYETPLGLMISLMIFSLFFFFSSFFSVYFLSLLFFFALILVHQLFFLQQEIVLSKWEEFQIKKQKENLIKSLSIEKNPKELKISDEKYSLTFEIPTQSKLLTSHNDFLFPIILGIQKEQSELPIIFVFPIEKNYPSFLFDLRIQSILSELKKQNRIDGYRSQQIPFLESLGYQDVKNQFFVFYDNFFADYVQFGYYLIPLNEIIIVVWIREITNRGFPHSLFVLDFLNKMKLQTQALPSSSE